VVEAGVVAVGPLGEAEVGALAAVPGNDVADEHGAVVARVPDHGLVLRASVPKAGSISLPMRSKLPSTVGVYSRPRMPPARFMGPVCMPPMPMSRKTRQSSGSPRLSSTDSPGPVI
jgi:hypothetical protein